MWEARNKWVFEKVKVDVFRVVRRVAELRKELNKWVFEKVKVDVFRVCDEGGGRWLKPEVRWVKLNVDAGVKEGWGMGIGAVCRDSEGVVLWGMTEYRRETLESIMAEAEAVLAGIKEARRRGCLCLVVESDCKVLIDALKLKTKRSNFHLLLDDIYSICNDFESVLWSFVSRKHNSVAHELAHLCSMQLIPYELQ
ncbi:uncharacterized protein LOC141587632 [Silene latifolia]|uniref:uncharacterized protein LOC141587632 n=1 Tax=Silene latifolia TaxID=37657 RepID=UPI003D76B38E